MITISHSQTEPSKSADNLIWLDMEMSGLLPDSDRILELAAVITDWPETNRRILLATRVNVAFQGLARHLLQVTRVE